MYNSNKPNRAQAKSQTEQGTKALKAFFHMAALWKLSSDESMCLLGLTASATFYKWRADPESARLSRDTVERLSYLLGIYKALQILFPNSMAANTWIRQPNNAQPFGGYSALERMLSGNVTDLYVVRQYLDAQRGGWT